VPKSSLADVDQPVFFVRVDPTVVVPGLMSFFLATFFFLFSLFFGLLSPMGYSFLQEKHEGLFVFNLA